MPLTMCAGEPPVPTMLSPGATSCVHKEMEFAAGTILLQCVQGYGGRTDHVPGRRVIAAGIILLQRIESCRRSIDQVFGCRGIGAREIDAGNPPTIHGASAATCGNRGLELAAGTIVL